MCARHCRPHPNNVHRQAYWEANQLSKAEDDVNAVLAMDAERACSRAGVTAHTVLVPLHFACSLLPWSAALYVKAGTADSMVHARCAVLGGGLPDTARVRRADKPSLAIKKLIDGRNAEYKKKEANMYKAMF